MPHLIQGPDGKKVPAGVGDMVSYDGEQCEIKGLRPAGYLELAGPTGEIIVALCEWVRFKHRPSRGKERRP